MISLLSSLSLELYLKIRWRMIETSTSRPQKSSAILENFWKMFGNVGVTFGKVVANLWKIVKNANICVSIIKRSLHISLKI